MDRFEPNIVAFLCNWCSYAGADLPGALRRKGPPKVEVIRVMCSGRVDERMLMKAFVSGADGVLVFGCNPGDCHYQTGNLETKKKIMGLQPFLDAVGIGQERLRLEWISVMSESQMLEVAETVSVFANTIKQLGPCPVRRASCPVSA